MCECGCTSNDERYTFPGSGFMHVLTLSKGCVDCCAPAGVTIEKIGLVQYRQLLSDGFFDGELKFEPWANGTKGVAIVTGFERHEFVKALLPQLVGITIGDMCDDGVMDEAGAEVLLEEMYDDSVVKPFIVEPAKAR